MAVTTPAPVIAAGDAGRQAPGHAESPPGRVVEVEPLVPVRTDLALQDGHRGAQRSRLGPRDTVRAGSTWTR